MYYLPQMHFKLGFRSEFVDPVFVALASRRRLFVVARTYKLPARRRRY
jgi:hypothetical protein